MEKIATNQRLKRLSHIRIRLMPVSQILYSRLTFRKYRGDVSEGKGRRFTIEEARLVVDLRENKKASWLYVLFDSLLMPAKLKRDCLVALRHPYTPTTST